MPRRPRISVPNGVYHVTSRGNRRQRVFVDNRDAETFLGMLATLSTRNRWRFHGYCLLPNHYHLVVETPDADLSSGMQRLNGEYAQSFNFFHGLDGHVFQGRFHAVLIESDPHLAELCRYLALNPVRAGLAATARAWRWSSYRHRRGSVLADIRRRPGDPGALRPRSRAGAKVVRPVRGGRWGDPSRHVPVSHDGV